MYHLLSKLSFSAETIIGVTAATIGDERDQLLKGTFNEKNI
jgi:hypothetical protein